MSMSNGLATAFLLPAAMFLSALLTSSASALPTTISLIGSISEATGPEPVGDVSVGDSFAFDITYESTAIQGIGDESIFFDGITFLEASIVLTIGTEIFTETSTGGSVSSLSFHDGILVGYNYRLAEFTPSSGALYFIFLENGELSQQFSSLPFGVAETRVRGTAPVPEPSTAVLVMMGLLSLSRRQRRA